MATLACGMPYRRRAKRRQMKRDKNGADGCSGCARGVAVMKNSTMENIGNCWRQSGASQMGVIMQC